MTLFFTTIGHSQQKAESFPEDFLGIYKGKLTIRSDGKDPVNISMEFHLLQTDTTDHYRYRLIYSDQPRNHTLIVDDVEKGLFRLDENNGIILPVRLIDNVLHSFFEVEGKLLTSRLAFYKSQIEFEILVTDIAGKTRTGEDTDYKIYGYEISTSQKALLKKQ